MTTRSLEIAETRGHPPTRAWALSMARWAAFRRGDMAESMRLSRELLGLAERLGFQARIATGQMMLGRALVANGDVEEGRRLLREGHAAWTAAGARATGTEYASHAAEVLLNAGLPDEAAYYVRAGEKLIGDIGERYLRGRAAAPARPARRGRRDRRRRRDKRSAARGGRGADGRPSRHPPHRRALLPSRDRGRRGAGRQASSRCAQRAIWRGC